MMAAVLQKKAWNTRKTIQLKFSTWKLLLKLTLFLTGTTFGTLAMFQIFQNDPTNGFPVGLSFLVTLTFAAFAIMQLKKLYNIDQPVLVIAPEGLQDTRNHEGPIPWKAIRHIWVQRRGKIDHLALSVNIEQMKVLLPNLGLRMTDKLGNDGTVLISTENLSVSADSLADIADLYAEAYQSPSADT